MRLGERMENGECMESGHSDVAGVPELISIVFPARHNQPSQPE